MCWNRGVALAPRVGQKSRSGARFSLLPPENATGNWVKVVQRVPVKILLDAKAGGNPQPLRAGMSAVVTVRLK